MSQRYQHRHQAYGTFQGVVTSADILEAIVGSFHTEEGPAEPAAVKRDDGSYLISGWMPAIEFAELLKIPLPISRQYQTIVSRDWTDPGFAASLWRRTRRTYW